MPNLVEISQTAAEIYGNDFSIFQDVGHRHVGFFTFEILNGQTAQEG